MGRTPVDVESWLSSEERNSAFIAGLVDHTDLDTVVPSCPAWSLRDLVGHVATRPAMWLALLGLRPGDIPDFDALAKLNVGAPLPPDDELAGWLTAEHGRLRVELRAADPTRPVWLFGATITPAELARRAAVELALHRWDAELALGASGSLDPEVATDGLDELVTCFIPLQLTLGAIAPDGGVLVEPTDTPRSWSLPPHGEEAVVDNATDAARTVLAGSASDLLLVAYRRVPWDRLAVEGSPQLARAWFEVFPEI
jgi:uncharacterized protein (TIGR03083 family)